MIGYIDIQIVQHRMEHASAPFRQAAAKLRSHAELPLDAFAVFLQKQAPEQLHLPAPIGKEIEQDLFVMKQDIPPDDGIAGGDPRQVTETAGRQAS